METLTSLAMPHGPHFAIEEQSAISLAAMLSKISVSVHRAEHVGKLREQIKARREIEIDAAAEGREKAKSKPYEMRDGIAIIDLSGPMTKHTSSLDEGTSTAYLRHLFEEAKDDPDVRGVMLRVDSPGGSVAGTDDLARAVAACARKKPVYGYIEDMGASAAYWVPSQCTKLYANPTALVGSLGTYAVLYDMSRMAEDSGIKVHVLSTGKYKGAGTPGAPINDEQLAQFQTTVDDLNEDFISAVARGRSMSKADTRELFDGAVYKAPKALKLGLIDGIASERKVLEEVRYAAYAKADDHSDVRATFEDVAAMEEPKIEILGEPYLATGAPEAEPIDGPTTEEKNSGEEGSRADPTLAEETESLLASTQVCIAGANALTGHLSRLKATRLADGRDLGPKAIGHIDDASRELAAAIGALQGSMDELVALRPMQAAPAAAEEPADSKSLLAREMLAAEIALAS